MVQKQDVQKVYSKRALKITLKTVLNSSIKERKVLSSKRILNFRTLVATEVWRPVSLYSNALQNDRPSPRTFLKTTARNSPSLQSVSSDGRIMCATKTESLNNVSTLCEDIILYTSTTRGIYPVANWHALCSPVEPNNNTHGTLNYSWHWKQNPQWPPEKKGSYCSMNSGCNPGPSSFFTRLHWLWERCCLNRRHHNKSEAWNEKSWMRSGWVPCIATKICVLRQNLSF